jgi:DNA-binding MarR family transcriptional regulator
MPRSARSNSELDMLTAVERGEVITQMALTQRIGVSIGLINALLRRAIRKGYVKARQVPYKRYAYYLTPQGFMQKSRLVAEYLEYSLEFFRQARSQYCEIFAGARARKCQTIVLVGGGEIAEIAVLAARSEGVELTAVLSDGGDSGNYGVRIIRSLSQVAPIDAAIITDGRDPQRAYEEMRKLLREEQVLAPPFLRITRDRRALVAAFDDPKAGRRSAPEIPKGQDNS